MDPMKTETEALSRAGEAGAPVEEQASESPSWLSGRAVDECDPLSRLLRRVFSDDWLKLWIAAFLLYGVAEKLLIPMLGGYLQLGGGIRTWSPHVEALLTGFVEFPYFLAYYLWSARAVVVLLEDLKANKAFEDTQRYRDFTDRLLRSCNRPVWSWISLALALVAAGLMHLVVWGPASSVPPWFGSRLGPRVLALALIGLVAYAVAQVVLRELLAVVWLRRLWSELGDDLKVNPYHEDGAGGLGAIGRHAVNFFIFIMMVMLFILMGSLLPSLLQLEAGGAIAFRFWSPLLLLIWSVYLLVVPLMFYLLLWPPHKAMEKVRDLRLRRIGQELDEHLRRAEDNLDGDQPPLEGALKEINNLKQVRSVVLGDSPVWPVSVESKRFFGLTSVIPTAYSALTFIVQFLK
jgi:hypothetical protein